jgi:signal transduction histidine kinase
VGSAADETERLVRLAEDLLLLARGDEAAPVVRPVTLDLVPAVTRSVEAHTDRARHQEVTLALATPAHAVLPADETRVRQMVDNLIDNALRFAPAGSTVDVGVAVQDTVARIEVADRGPGFPPEFLPHAFERFRRPDHDRNRGHGGGGLGLSIVQSLAQGHRGWAEAANRASGGAVVSISLPLDPAASQPARSVDHRRARRHRGLGAR